MSEIIQVATGAYPLTINDVKTLLYPPNTSFIEPWELPSGLEWVIPSNPEKYNKLTHKAVKSKPVLIDDSWHQSWNIEPLSTTEREDAIKDAKELLLATTTAKRWEVETGGITLPNGVKIATDTADQNRITSVISNSELAGIEILEFKSVSGFVTITLEQLKGISIAITLHVQACFAAESLHHKTIIALTDPEEIDSYDVNSGWPVSLNEVVE